MNYGYNNNNGQQQPQQSYGGYQPQGQYGGYGQQQQQQKPRANPLVSFALTCDIKQSTKGYGDYFAIGIKYMASNQKEKQLSVRLTVKQTQWSPASGYKVLDVSELRALYDAIGYALSQAGSLPPQQPVAPQQSVYQPQQQQQQAPAYYPQQQPQQPLPQPPKPTTFAEVMAMNKFDAAASVTFCEANGIAHLIPAELKPPQPVIPVPETSPAPPISTEEIPY